jgi:hypothetical protein
LRLPKFDEQLELHRIDVLSASRNLEDYAFIKQCLEELSNERLAPPRLLTGRDLIEAGFEPGPTFSVILTAAEDAQLEGRVTTREEALAFVRAQFPRPA